MPPYGSAVRVSLLCARVGAHVCSGVHRAVSTRVVRNMKCTSTQAGWTFKNVPRKMSGKTDSDTTTNHHGAQQSGHRLHAVSLLHRCIFAAGTWVRARASYDITRGSNLRMVQNKEKDTFCALFARQRVSEIRRKITSNGNEC